MFLDEFLVVDGIIVGLPCKLVRQLLSPSYWRPLVILGYEAGAPPLDRFTKITRPVYCRTTQLADVSMDVLLLGSDQRC